MKNLRFKPWTFPIALLALCGLSYGLLAPWLGFYWDDWPTIWYLHLLGPSGFLDVFSVDRPPLGWLFVATTSVLGESMLAWQIFAVAARWLCCLAFWWTLRQVWPQNRRLAAWAAILFAVYPGFTQNSIAVTYSNAWLILAVFLLSLGTMVRATRSSHRAGLWLGISALLAGLTLFIEEYYFGLEFLRPVLLWLGLGAAFAGFSRRQQLGQLLRRVFLYWLPYLAIIAVFLYWRNFVHVSPRGRVQVFDHLARDPLGTVIEIGQLVVQDFFQSSLIAWGRVFDIPQLLSYGRGPTLLYLAVVLISIPLILFYLAKFKPEYEETAHVKRLPGELAHPAADSVPGSGRASERASSPDGRPKRAHGMEAAGQGSSETSFGEASFAEISFTSAAAPPGNAADGGGSSPNASSAFNNQVQGTAGQAPLSTDGKGGKNQGLSAGEGTRTAAFQAITLGALGLLLGGIPFWVTYLPIELRFPWDRFTLAMMLGASLLIAGLLLLIPGRDFIKVVLIGIAVGLAVGFHVQQANLYRREWNLQKAFFWQLAWRAPAIQPGTALITAELPFTFFSDNSLTAPLNWIYAPENTSRQMSYLLYAVESRLKLGLPRFEKGLPIHQPYRATSFEGTTSQVMAIFSEPPGCVKVVDPAVDARLPQKPNFIAELLPLSDPALIEADPQEPARPPEAIFGPELPHGWCYYFEKADLARQSGDWEQVVKLGNQAFKFNERLYEVNAPELVPYIEGYARTGHWDRAQELTLQAERLTFRMRRMLCATWDRIEANTAPGEDGLEAIKTMNEKLRCE